MSLEPHLESIDRTARRHGLPPELVRAIVTVESNGNPWAARYEPAFYNRHVAPKPVKTRPPCSEQTEMRLRACSFGLMQIMGATAREVGFEGVFLTELCDPEVGLDWGCRYLAQLARLHYERHGWAGVVAAYNAGSPRKLADGRWVNEGYVNKIHAQGGFR